MVPFFVQIKLQARQVLSGGPMHWPTPRSPPRSIRPAGRVRPAGEVLRRGTRTDIGHFINEKVQIIPDIQGTRGRSSRFKAFLRRAHSFAPDRRRGLGPMGYPGIQHHSRAGHGACCHLLVDAQRQAVLLGHRGWSGEPWLIRRRPRPARPGAERPSKAIPAHPRAISTTPATSPGPANGPAHRSTRPPRWSNRISTAPIRTQGVETHGAGRLETRRPCAVCVSGGPAAIDIPIADGDELPFWGGLRRRAPAGPTRSAIAAF